MQDTLSNFIQVLESFDKQELLELAEDNQLFHLDGYPVTEIKRLLSYKLFSYCIEV